MTGGAGLAVGRQRWWICARPGVALAWLIASHRDACVAAAKFSGAVQALTAAGGLVVIGTLLLNAGRPHAGPTALPPVSPDSRLQPGA